MKFALCLLIFVTSGCQGLKVVRPDDPVEQNKGTLALDVSGGSMKLVETYTCTLKSMGANFSAVGKTEESARNEVVAKCKDRTVISFCKPENATCSKN